MNNIHAPSFLENAAENGIVIFVHGFMGSPRQFDDFAAAVYESGRSTASILLSGHGGSVKDFTDSTFSDWQEHVNREVGRFSKIYSGIWLVGHSMGGLLSLISSVKYCETVCGVVAIASPFEIKYFSAKSTKVRVKLALSKKSNPVKTAYLDSDSVPQSFGLWFGLKKPVSELKKLMRAAREILPLVRAPVLAVYSASDETVELDNIEIFESELSSAKLEVITVSDSLHAYYTESERELIKRAILSFLG